LARFWIKVDASLLTPLRVGESTVSADAFFRTFVVAANASEEAIEVVRALTANEGARPIEAWWELLANDDPESLRAGPIGLDERGILWRTGHVYYTRSRS
jgi:hypothetical protein